MRWIFFRIHSFLFKITCLFLKGQSLLLNQLKIACCTGSEAFGNFC